MQRFATRVRLPYRVIVRRMRDCISGSCIGRSLSTHRSSARRGRRRIRFSIRASRVARSQPYSQDKQQGRNDSGSGKDEGPRSSVDGTARHLADTIKSNWNTGGRFPKPGSKLRRGGRCTLQLRYARPFRQYGKFLQKRKMPFSEGRAPGGKNFEDSVDRATAPNRQDGNRTQTEAAADRQIDQRIVLGVSAMLDLSGAQTLARNSSLRTQMRAQNRGEVATARAAHHRPFLPHRQRGSGGPSQLPGDIRNRPKNEIQAVVSSIDQLLERPQNRPLVGILREFLGRAGRFLQQRVSIGCGRYFAGAIRLGLRHSHGSLGRQIAVKGGITPVAGVLFR